MSLHSISPEGSTRGRLGRAAALVVDNPILEKDALTMLRAAATPLVVGGAGLALLALVAFVHVVNEPGAHDLLSWRGMQPSSRFMFVALCGALLALTTLFVPALASSAIAGERERGTLPLLTVSALSPARIVAGKLAAVLVAVAPVGLCSVALFGLASIYGGVSLQNVLFALAFGAFHVVCVACAGLGASSVVGRARIAAPLAMLFAGVPTFFSGFPAVGLLALYANGELPVLIAPIVVGGAAVSAAFAAACLLLARDQLSPANAPRWPLRRPVVAALLAGLAPLVAASFRMLDDVAKSDLDEITGVAAFAVLLCVALAAVAEVCVSDARPRAERVAPRRRAMFVAGVAGLGFLLAGVVPQSSHPRFDAWAEGPALLFTAPGALGIAALWVAFAASLAALAARFVRRPVARGALTFGVLAGLFVLPFIVHELRWFLPFDGDALAFANPLLGALAAIGELHGPFDATSAVASAVFFAVASGVALALARPRDVPPVTSRP